MESLEKKSLRLYVQNKPLTYKTIHIDKIFKRKIIDLECGTAVQKIRSNEMKITLNFHGDLPCGIRMIENEKRLISRFLTSNINQIRDSIFPDDLFIPHMIHYYTPEVRDEIIHYTYTLTSDILGDYFTYVY